MHTDWLASPFPFSQQLICFLSQQDVFFKEITQKATLRSRIFFPCDLVAITAGELCVEAAC